MIEAHSLTKRYGRTTAVDRVSFTVQPGQVTGFLGPNGAGKSTTMRMIVGLDRPTEGTVTINGRPYSSLRAPLTEVGALLDARATHPGVTARNHLRALAATHALPSSRVEEVIRLTGIGSVADKRVKGFSLGMGQRLGIAAALLGDPHTLILDEPVNGLDPEGVHWVRTLLRHLAGEGRTILLSSHLMSEMQLTADRLVVLGRGRVIADASVAELVARTTTKVARVTSPRADELATALRTAGATVTLVGPSVLEVSGMAAQGVGDLAATQGIALHELVDQTSSLEDAYLALTNDQVEYRSGEAGPASSTTGAAAGAAPVHADALAGGTR